MLHGHSISKSRELNAANELTLELQVPAKAGSKEYYREACYIAKKHNVHFSKVEICTDHPVGEIVIFVNKVWAGYIDYFFYLEMDTGLTEDELLGC